MSLTEDQIAETMGAAPITSQQASAVMDAEERRALDLLLSDIENAGFATDRTARENAAHADQMDHDRWDGMS